MIPTYFVGLSVLLFLLGVVTSSNAYKSLHSKLFKRAIQDDEDLMDDSPAIPIAFATEIRQHISKHGGPAIFFGKCLQLLGSVVLLGLSVASAILNDNVSGKQENDFDAWEKKGKKKRPEPPLTIDEGLELAMCMFYVSLFNMLLNCVSYLNHFLKIFSALYIASRLNKCFCTCQMEPNCVPSFERALGRCIWCLCVP